MVEKRISFQLQHFLLAAVVCVLAFLFSFLHGDFAHAAQTVMIPDGVEISGIDLSGMTADEAREAIDTYVAEVQAGTLYLTYEDEITFEFSMADLSVELADAEVAEKIASIGSEENILQRYMTLSDVENGAEDYTISFTFDSETLTELLTEAAEENFNVAAVDSEIEVTGNQFVVTEASSGLELNVEETVSSVAMALTAGFEGTTVTVALTAQEVEPAYSAEDLSYIKDLLGSYSTDFSSSSSNRKSNIKRAAELINGTVVYPGEEFSYLEAVTPISTSNGYSTATAYSGGKVVESVGGGVCQVSSTLYNAVLEAELTVTSRRNHSMTVSYVPLAQDATVSQSGGIDFTFQNDYEYPIYIVAYTSGDTLYVEIYGYETRAENRTIEFVSVTEQTIEPGDDVVTEDDTLPSGYTEVTQSAHTGYVAALYKYIYIDGELESTVLINRSTYQATPRYVTKGTMETSEETEEETETETETEAAETEAETKAAETEAETEAAETEAETKAAETEAETEAAETEAETEAAETEAAETEAETKAAETEAAQTEAAETEAETEADTAGTE